MKTLSKKSSSPKSGKKDKPVISQHHRQDTIVKLIQDESFVSIDYLVKYFLVTPQTIRRDLTTLAKANKIQRHHGGAGVSSSVENNPYQDRKIMNLEAKDKIAKKLVTLIPDGSSLFINIGTTNEAVARALVNHKNLHIVTNNLHVAAILSPKADFTVIIAAGEIRYKDGGIVGDATRDFIEQFRMDFGVIGISGIHSDGSLLDFDYREVRVARSIIQHSSQTILAADHSKFGRNAMVSMGNISEVEHLVTDRRPPEEFCAYMNEYGVHLHIA